MADNPFRPYGEEFRWSDVPLHAYKDEGAAPFKDVTRQTLFRSENMAGELRYFEVAPGGHTTLERHQHGHAVMVLRGKGRCLVGARLYELGVHDLVEIPPLCWHQFRATIEEPLGFLCMVDQERDRPQLPGEDDIERLRADPAIAEFIRVR